VRERTRPSEKQGERKGENLMIKELIEGQIYRSVGDFLKIEKIEGDVVSYRYIGYLHIHQTNVATFLDILDRNGYMTMEDWEKAVAEIEAKKVKLW
jgi:hypothetical protein